MQSLKELGVKNVVDLLGFGITKDDRLFLVESFYEKSIRDLYTIKEEEPTEPSIKKLKSEHESPSVISAKEIFLTCFNTLQIAHYQLDLAHLDIKLDNVLVDTKSNKIAIAGIFNPISKMTFERLEFSRIYNTRTPRQRFLFTSETNASNSDKSPRGKSHRKSCWRMHKRT